MEKNNKKLVFTIFYGVMLALATIGTLQLLYNAATMLIYNISGNYAYDELQLPFAIITLLASLFAIAFVVLEIISICTKKEKNKKIYFIINMVFIVLIAATVIACKVVFMENYVYKYFRDDQIKFPLFMGNDVRFAMYQSVMALLITQLVYTGIIGAMRIAQRICAKKNKLVKAEENTADNAIKE